MRHVLLLLAFLAAPTLAAPLNVRVVDARGNPVRDAVVTLRPIGSAGPVPQARNTYRVEQRDLQFHPFVSVVPVGAVVNFPNFDATRHHVYSFSAAKKFELKLFAKDQSRSVRFDRAGTIAIGCNIHDQMSAFLFVTDTIWTVRTDANGNAAFRDAPGGAVTLGVWHPYLRAPSSAVSRRVSLTNERRDERIGVQLRAPPMHDMSGY